MEDVTDVEPAAEVGRSQLDKTVAGKHSCQFFAAGLGVAVDIEHEHPVQDMLQEEHCCCTAHTAVQAVHKRVMTALDHMALGARLPCRNSQLSLGRRRSWMR